MRKHVYMYIGSGTEKTAQNYRGCMNLKCIITFLLQKSPAKVGFRCNIDQTIGRTYKSYRVTLYMNRSLLR